MREVLHSTKSAEGKKWCACRIKGTRGNQKPTLALQSGLWQQPEIEREKLSCRFNCLCALLINLTWFDVCYHLIRHFESFTSLCSVATRIHIHSLDGLTLYRTVSSESVHTHTFVSLSISSDRFEERVGERRRKRAQWNGNSLAFKCNLIKICIVHLLHSWIFCSIVQMCNRILRATHTHTQSQSELGACST